MKELLIVKDVEIQNIVINEIEKNERKKVNKDIEKILTEDINVIIYNKRLSVGYDLSFFNKVTIIGLGEEFFKEAEGKQLLGRFNRVERKVEPIIL